MLNRMRSWLTGSPRHKLTQLLGNAPLPVMRQSAMAALTELRDPDVNLGAVGERISGDPALSVTVLRHANSAASGLRRQVGDVRHAVRLMGRSTAEAVIVAEMVREAIPQTAAPGFEPARFWAAAARRSALARELARILDPANTMVVGTAALLQDVAIPLLAHRQPETYGPVLTRWHNNGGDLPKAEQDAFGWDHSCVGEWLCELWGLPQNLTDLISTHHSGDTECASVVLVSALSENPGADDVERVLELARERFGTAPATILQAFDRADQAA